MPTLTFRYMVNHRIPIATKIFLLEHLRVMLRAGIPIRRALASIHEHLRPRALASALAEVSTAVERGSGLADALAAHPWILPPMAVELIRAGEASGTLEETLQEIAQLMRKEDALRSSVRNALLYPTIVVGAMTVMVVGIVVFVLPRLLAIFEGVTVPLPLPTRVLLAVTAVAQAHGIAIAIVAVVVIAAAILFLRSRTGRRGWHHAVLRLGPIGRLAREVQLTRIARTLGGLLRTDIPIVRGLDLTAATVTNDKYRDALAAAARVAERGGTISAAFGAAPALFPPTAIQLITVGEETGQLDALLEELAAFYELDVDRTLKNLTTIIEPLLIIAIGVGIAFIAVAVLQPMYSIAEAI